MKLFLSGTSFHSCYGGPARSVSQLAVALSGAGVDVGVWAPDGSALETAFLPKESAVKRLGGTEGEALEEFGQPEVIHDNGIWMPHNHRLAKLASERGIPRIVSTRGMLEPWAINHKRWKKRLAWLLYQKKDLRSAAVLHATAETEATNLRALGLNVPISVIPNGIELPEGRGQGRGDRKQEIGDRRQGEAVDDSRSSDKGTEEDISASQRFSVCPVRRPEGTRDQAPFGTRLHSPSTRGRASSAFSPGTRSALFLSRIQKKKGLPMLIDAWAKVRPEGWRLRIAGPDEDGHRAEVERLVQARGLNGVVEFTGELEGEAKREAFQDAELFVLPTHSENFGIVIAEALAHGVPAITTHGAPWQLLETERCGWWTPVSVDGIAAALREATAKSPEELAAMGARGRNTVAERFAWPAIAEDFVKLYGRVVEGAADHFKSS